MEDVILTEIEIRVKKLKRNNNNKEIDLLNYFIDIYLFKLDIL